MTPLDVAKRFLGTHEDAKGENPLIQWWLSLCGFPSEVKDEVPWCSAFVNGVAFILGLRRTRSAAARSWLNLEGKVDPLSAVPGFDVVVLKRGGADQPGPEVVNAQGHVGFFLGWTGDEVVVLGGNQSNAVTIEHFKKDRVLGIRRLA